MPSFIGDQLSLQIKNLPFWLIKELDGLENLIFTSGKGADLLFKEFLRLSADQQEVFQKCHENCKVLIKKAWCSREKYDMQDIFRNAVDPVVRDKSEQELFRKLLGILFALKRAVKKSLAAKLANDDHQDVAFVIILPPAEIPKSTPENAYQQELFLGITFQQISREKHFCGLYLDYKYDLQKRKSCN